MLYIISFLVWNNILYILIYHTAKQCYNMQVIISALHNVIFVWDKTMYKFTCTCCIANNKTCYLTFKYNCVTCYLKNYIKACYIICYICYKITWYMTKHESLLSVLYIMFLLIWNNMLYIMIYSTLIYHVI